MSNSTTNINIFEKLLHKFKFKYSLPDEVKKFIIRNERNALITTFKRFNEYNFIYGLVIRLYYLSYKLRLRFSIKQSKIILGILSSLVLVAMSVSILFAVEYIKSDELVLPNNQLSLGYEEKSDNTNSIINIKEVKKPVLKDTGNRSEYVKYRLGVNLFSAKNTEQDFSKNVTDRISGELSRRLGQNKVIDLRRNQKGVSYNRILSGSVAGLGKKFIISAKVIDVENTKVIFGVNETVDSFNEMNKKCTDIAEMIVKEIEWK